MSESSSPPYTPHDPRTALKAHGLWAKKHFGQNFLVAASAPERIALAGGAGPGDVVFEIGAGCGTLTRALAARAGRVIGLEHDRELVPVAQAELAPWTHAEIREGNVLDVDWNALALELGGPPLIYGNLPYHLSTPILLALLEAPTAWRRACFLLQREFAERLAAAPGTHDCGVLSAYAALRTKPRIAFRLPPGAFHPPPKVESAVLTLECLPAPVEDVGQESVFREVVRALFAQRRKTARNSLRAACPTPEAALEAAGLAPERRGETFTLAELAALSRAVVALR